MEIPSTPYPWGALEKVPRAAALAMRKATAALLDPTLPRRIEPVAAQLLRMPGLQLVSRRVRMASPARPAFPNGVLCLIANQPRTLHALVEVEPELAYRIACSLLSKPPLWIDRSQPTPPTLHAAFGAFLISTVRKTSPDHDLHLVAVGTAARQGFLAFAPDPFPCIDLAVCLPDATFGATVAHHTSPTPSAASPPFDRNHLRSIGHVPLRLELVAAQSLCSRTDLSSLAIGDAWMPGKGWLLDPSDPLHGPLLLMPRSSCAGLKAELRPDGQIVLREGTMQTPDEQPEDTDSVSTGEPSTTDVLGDAPVIVRVEVGAVTLTAKEWAAVQPGDLLTTGSRIAERVSLRVAGIEVARGQLVDVEGEIGVRILEIVSSKDGGS